MIQCKIVRSVWYRMSLVQDDDFTQLAAILVVEACVRHHMTREAIEVITSMSFGFLWWFTWLIQLVLFR